MKAMLSLQPSARFHRSCHCEPVRRLVWQSPYSSESHSTAHSGLPPPGIPFDHNPFLFPLKISSDP